MLEVLKFRIKDVESTETKRLERELSSLNRSQFGFKEAIRAYITSEQIDFQRLCDQHPDCVKPTYQSDPYFYILIRNTENKPKIIG